MTDETYQKVCEINNQLEALCKVKSEIQDSHRHYLTYACRPSLLYNTKDYMCDGRTLSAIRKILDKHDQMIRQEIDDEIDKLKKQIAEL